jgi:hypothetical protein
MVKQKLVRVLLGLVVAASIWGATISWVERSRTMEGTWINLFESSKFFEGETLTHACGKNFWRAPWFAFYPPPESRLFGILDKNSRNHAGQFVYNDSVGPVVVPVTAYKIKFVGHRRVSEFLGFAPILGVGYGHLAASGSEVAVERLISIELIPNVMCDVR